MISSTNDYLVYASIGWQELAIWFITLAVWLAAAGNHAPPPTDSRPAGLSRRFLAFLIDIVVCFALVLVPVTLAVLLLEFVQTGDFSWYVERREARSTDVFVFIGGFASFLGGVVLYAVPAWRGRQSPGGVVFGVYLRSPAPVSLWRAVSRACFGYVTICTAFISVPMALMRRDRRMWHDLFFHTSVHTG